MDSLYPLAHPPTVQTSSFHAVKKVYYEKVGRRYRPVAEYDSELLDSFSKGVHLVDVYPGGRSTRFNINPNHAALIAASRVSRTAMVEAIAQAAEMRQRNHSNGPLTPEQHAAWTHFVKVMGESGRYVEFKSVSAIAEAGTQALIQEAAKLMEHPAVRDAYERFQTVCKLVKQKD